MHKVYARNTMTMDFMCTYDIDVCAITETWLSNDIGDSEFLPNGYQIVRKDRYIEFYPDGCFTAHNRGGVALVIKSELKPKLCTENNPRAELIWCDIEPSPGKSTTIGCRAGVNSVFAIPIPIIAIPIQFRIRYNILKASQIQFR